MIQNCDYFIDKIPDLVNGSLDENLANETTEHIKQCKECAKIEKTLRNEEELLGRLFESFNQDMDRQMSEVIKAIECIELSKQEKIMNKVQMVIVPPTT